MNNNKTVRINKHRTLLTIILFLCTCLFMHNFYKCLSGFVANNYDDGIMMITMIVNYILPVFCFLFFFYNYFIKPINKIAATIYSVVVIGVASFALFGIFKNFNVYASNNHLGVYGSLPSIIVRFPYDGLITNFTLIAVQVFNLITTFKPKHKYSYLKEQLYYLGYFKINTFEYLFYSVIAILTFFAVGDFISGLNLLPNITYDGKIIFLLLWVLIIPLTNLISFIFKFEKRDYKKSHKLIYLSSLIGINLIFGLLFYIFEVNYPNFIVSIGKPLFPITYSISFPVEIIAILAIQAISVLINLLKITLIAIKNPQQIKDEN